jgi:hypothetical protein
MKKLLIALFSVFAMANANAALLDGKTINYQYYFPNVTSPYSNSDNGDKVVGAGIEVSNVADNRATMDISDTNIYIDFLNSSGWSSSTFNGFKLTDTFNNIASFTSISINAATNMVGFSLSNITVLADEIWVNWQGLSFDANTIVSLDINTSAVPVPAALFLFAPALLGFIGFRRKVATAA